MGAQGLEDGGRDLAGGNGDLLALRANGGRGAGALEIGGLALRSDRPGELLIGNLDGVDGVEGLENLLIGAQAERTQEDGAEELALAIDADVEGCSSGRTRTLPNCRGRG